MLLKECRVGIFEHGAVLELKDILDDFEPIPILNAPRLVYLQDSNTGHWWYKMLVTEEELCIIKLRMNYKLIINYVYGGDLELKECTKPDQD